MKSPAKSTPIWLCLILLFGAFASHVNGATLAITVKSADSSAPLVKARVELVPDGRAQLTNEFGVAEFFDVAPGNYTARISYLGFTNLDEVVQVTTDTRQSRSVQLKNEGMVILSPFIVTAELEGNAAALNQQKQAENVKNVVAMDALGVLANDNPAEILTRIAGIYSLPSTEGNFDQPTIRGMNAALNTVTIDGAQLAPTQGMSRQNVFTNITASNFEELEVTKALTPDLPADSISGRIDFKTKTALNMKAKREFSYRIGGKWAAEFFDYTPRRYVPAVVPNLSISYRERFSVLGDESNLGLATNAVYSANVTQTTRTISRLDTGAEIPRFRERYERRDGIQDRLLRTANARVDFKLSPDSRFYFSWLRNLQKQYLARPDHYQMIYLANIATAGRAFATGVNANGTPSGGGNIHPDSTENYTTVLPSARTSFQITTSPFEANDQTNYYRFGGEHRYGPWKIDYNASYSNAVRNVGAKHRADGGITIVANSATGIGWTLDLRDDPAGVFTQTAGASIYDPKNYTLGTITQDSRHSDSEFATAGVNVKRDVRIAGHPLQMAAGGLVKSQKFSEQNDPANYTYVGPDGVAGVNPVTGINDATIDRFVANLDLTSKNRLQGLPAFDPNIVGSSLLSEPQAWRKDEYAQLDARRASTHSVQEDITAAYLMGSTRFGRLGVVGGVRWERTDTEAVGFIKGSTQASITDPLARVNAEYGTSPIVRRGSHDEFFPSMHFRYGITRNLIARASYSTSIGRPSLNNLLPNFSVSDTSQRITIDNPSLKSQFAESIDLSLEYYLKPLGQLSVGLFRKNLTDFLFTESLGFVETGPNNGYGGLYGGYEIFTSGNGGSGKVQGIELSYLQQLTFLPGFLRGFTVLANYTRLQTAGDYGTTSTNLSGFTPVTANLRLGYQFKRLGTYAQWSYVGRAQQAFNATPYLMTDTLERRIVNVGFSVKLPRNLEFFFDVSNLFDEPQRTAQHVSNSRINTIYNGPFVNFGIGGRF